MQKYFWFWNTVSQQAQTERNHTLGPVDILQINVCFSYLFFIQGVVF